MKSLFEAFVLPNYAAWHERVQKDLKGESFEEKLFWQAEEGLAIEALPVLSTFSAQALAFDPQTGQLNPYNWLSMPFWEVSAGQEALCNKAILQSLNQGAEGLLVRAQNGVDWPLLLKNVELAYCALGILANDSNTLATQALDAYLRPLKPFLLFSNPHEGSLSKPGLTLVNVSTTTEISRDIAEALQTAKMLLQHTQGETPQAWDFSRVGFSVRLSNYFFSDIAKLKALRLLYAMLAESYGADFSEKDAFVHAQTSLLQSEPNSNMISNTSQALAGALGGVQALTVLPHEESVLGHRIALNISNLLKEEAHIGRVADPLAGAYFIENFTQKLAEKVFERLTKV